MHLDMVFECLILAGGGAAKGDIGGGITQLAERLNAPVVMTAEGQYVEVQGTAEGKPFPKQAIDDLLSLAEKGIRQLFQVQQEVLNLV